MAQNSDNIAIVRPKVAGAAYVADAGTACPTTAAETATGFDSLGWLSEDGITMSIDRETTDIIGFGGDVALTISESHDLTFTIKPMELNVHVLGLMFNGANVTMGSGSAVESVKVNADDPDEFALMFDLRGRGGQLIRVCVPKAKVTEMGEVPLKHNEPIASEMTIKAFPDASGNKAYIYFGKEA